MATKAVRRFGIGFLLAVVLAACGSSGGEAGDPPRSTSITGSEATSTASTSTSTTSSSSEPSTSSPLAPDEDLTQLQFRPVLGIAATIDGTTTTTADPDGPSGLVVERADGGPTYTLGPIAFDGTALTSARAVQNEGSWIVEVQAADDSRRAANEAFNACFDAEPTCPAQSGSGRGAIGIVLQGQLISAPEVNGLDLASDEFVISGDLDQGEAEHIADLING